MRLDRPALEVAPELLGAVLSVDGVAVRLTEVEAYEGESDPASHAWRGPTPRNAVMYGPAGRLYVYLSYGIHSCVNIVCDVEGRASAVLLRAGEVVAGEERVRTRRGAVPHRRLASGPGNVGSALGLSPDRLGSPARRAAGVSRPGSEGPRPEWPARRREPRRRRSLEVLARRRPHGQHVLALTPRLNRLGLIWGSLARLIHREPRLCRFSEVRQPA